MQLFRSEEHVQAWSSATRTPVGAIFPLDALWALSKLWFHDRLSPGWRRRTMEEAHENFAAAGLTGSFWRLDG